MPPAERRALLLLLGLAVAGQAVRYLVTRPGQAPGQVELLATLSPGSPLAQRDSAMHQARPLAAGEKVDVDAAGVSELARLPKVGPGLAKTIVADRDAHGAFGSLEGLDRVPGIGPGLLKVLALHVRFSGAAATGTQCLEASAPLPRCPPTQGVPARLSINTASAADLDALPGIGPAKAAAILQYRKDHGPFAAVDDLARVPGFGPAAVARLRPRLSAQ
jgi:competence protein ComEA